MRSIVVDWKINIILRVSVRLLMLSIGLSTAVSSRAYSLEGNSIASIHRDLLHHKISCVELTNAYLQRIQQYNLALNRGAPINAFTVINQDAINDARRLDASFTKMRKLYGALHCIPVVVKDNIDTAAMPSTSGSLALLGTQSLSDAFVVRKLRRAGAIIIGKSAMDEFASGMTGISSRSGRVGNAIDPNKNAGGSSSGTAAALAANFAVIGLGTDNSGSIRIPAGFNGIYGLRPSTGLLSISGIFPRGNLDGVVGPMARNIPDLARALSVLAAESDLHDARTIGILRQQTYSIKSANYLRGKRIGVIKSVAGIDPWQTDDRVTHKIIHDALALMKQRGVVLVNIVLPYFDSNRDHNTAGEIEDINAYLAGFPAVRDSMADICHSGRAPVFGNRQQCLQQMRDTPNKSSKTYRNVVAHFEKNRQYVREIMLKNNLDALVMPLNANGAASNDISRVNTWRAPVASNSGLPAITIIAGYDHAKPAMPIGLELIGKIYDEAELLALAYAYSVHAPSRREPQLGQMREFNLQKFTIPEYNNAITRIGYTTFKRFLQNGKADAVTADVFRKIVREAIKPMLKEKLRGYGN